MSDKLFEYTADGGLVREIKLPYQMALPQLAIKLDNSNIIIIYGMYEDYEQRVCPLDTNGHLQASFGGEKGPSKEHLRGPTYLAVDKEGMIFVAEYANSRVQLLSQSLKLKRIILSKDTHGLRVPWSRHVDEAIGRLFVVDNDYENPKPLKVGRILVYLHVYKKSSLAAS